MTALLWLVPVALMLGGLGLAAFLWCLRAGQFDDLEGAGWRALDDDAPVAQSNGTRLITQSSNATTSERQVSP